MLKFSTAAILASAFVLLGAVLEGSAGIETLAGLTHLDLGLAVVCSLGAAITVTIMTIIGLPVSTSQAVVGAIMGIGVLNRQLNVAGMGKVVACWFGTPVGAAFIAILVYRGLGVLYNRLDAFSALVVVLAEAITMHAYTFVGVPVSASQAVVGAALGVGIVKGVNTIRRRTLVNILLGWVLTLAVACFLALAINVVAHLHYMASG